MTIFINLLKGILLSLRPHQWIKNLFIFAPLIFSKEATDIVLIFKVVQAFFSFSLIAGSVYIFNDIIDFEQDKVHPVKRFRPIASGMVSINSALIIGIFIITGSVIWTYFLEFNFFILSIFYFLINILYSFKLKSVPFVDVVIIAIGFGLRILGGAFIINVMPSIWLILCGFILALFLAIGKRRHEITHKDAEKQRKVLSRYTVKNLNYALYSTGILTSVTYLLYCLSPRTRHFFNTNYMIITLPFVIAGVLRFIQLVVNSKDAHSPTELMIKDIPFIINLFLWGVAAVLLIYII